MLIFFKQNLALLAVPKTGTTAYAAALRGKADIIFKGRRKHTSATGFDRHVAPFLAKAYKLTPERVAVMREPLDQMRSWYKYRTRLDPAKTDKSTAGMSFDQFIRDAIETPDLPHVKLGSQHNFLTLKDGTIALHHLFAYEHQERYRSFLEERFGHPLELGRANASPDAPAEIREETVAAFREARAADYALHQRLLEAGGHLALEYHPK